jgi:hypothetical protein
MYCTLQTATGSIRRRVRGYREMAMQLIQAHAEAELIAPTGVRYFLQGNSLMAASPGVFFRPVLTFNDSERRVFARVCEHYDDTPEIQRRISTYEAKRIAGTWAH